MTWLVTSDLHLTDRPEHEYRFEFLDWLAQQAVEQDADHIFILGDISDAKDRHSGVLVNRVVDALRQLADARQLHVLYGNHDGPSLERPFWKFLCDVQDIFYYTRFGIWHSRDLQAAIAMSPWGTEEEAIEAVGAKKNKIDYLFMHATVSGAQVENGTCIEGGMPSKFLPEGSKTKVYSGDIHVPQICGDVEYVGAPYHVHYGDAFTPRVVLIEPETRVSADLHWTAGPRLHTLHLDIDNLQLPDRIRRGDRVKLIATASRQILPADWQQYVRGMRQKVEAAGATLFAATFQQTASKSTTAPSPRRSDESIVRTFAAAQKYNEAVTEVGVGIAKG